MTYRIEDGHSLGNSGAICRIADPLSSARPILARCHDNRSTFFSRGLVVSISDLAHGGLDSGR